MHSKSMSGGVTITAAIRLPHHTLPGKAIARTPTNTRAASSALCQRQSNIVSAIMGAV